MLPRVPGTTEVKGVIVQRRVTRTRPLRRVTVSVLVSAEIVNGVVTAEGLAAWVEEALDRYYTFRKGHVGINAAAGMHKPVVKRDG